VSVQLVIGGDRVASVEAGEDKSHRPAERRVLSP
jgi:hypothetical protein